MTLESDETLLRYSRQIMLPQVGVEGQEKLLNAHLLIIGMGGLGAPAAIYLAAAGVGHITLVDFDKVDLSNLQRQIVHTTADIGRPKVESAQDTLHNLNPEIEITAINKQLSEQEMGTEIAKVDLVLDCSDNFTTRFSVNRLCVTHQKPLVSGAAIRMEGQISVFRPDLEDEPCYQCLYKGGDELDESCTQSGVLAPLVGIIGSMQALEAMKIIMEIGQGLNGKLMLLDTLTMEWRTLKLRKDPQCPVCATSTTRI
ncbi:MAG: molybdopterin-synthase adenylyltransferase MoeB [Gammaproteobacteria bacterium]|jgi:adenylyltransferase/sulfurtransferase|nr:molybdopterin-synthase adenylyltransferase MoeB [Gammaproteobacteria bacterium]MBT3489310.1 molybdopterin-synthase adenylyltransferase MoeB [Gammaproteobacteria bacterium]MBT3718690.1 molybdopterin-synthase adenylyltransferase MoeB [Gammaproteobacteria bacterium]MBT3843786.1 molybdopterin-synthase adenylyltransferase MoeB [Gammaproteobacteria bacterium]MBT3893988.1 molybdopterin-synthase adenylyltransferase MoeB [Gammaproteobacteria bacterium]